MTMNIRLIRLLILLLFISLSNVHAQKRAGNNHNPVIEGWYADPEGIVFDREYWIYPTYSAPYEEQVFMDAFSSRDLVNWEKHARIIDTSAVTWAWRAMWAPAIIKKDGKYFLFFAANDIQNNEETGGIGIGIADKPQGQFRDYLGRPLLREFHNGAQPIDQFVFRDRDGSYYMIYGGWRHCNIVRLKDDFTGFLPMEDGSLFRVIIPKMPPQTAKAKKGAETAIAG